MAKTNNGLMKKTKAQLIEIILRKDDVERECRDEINNLKNRIKNYDCDVEGMSKRIKEDKDTINKQEDIIKQQADLIVEKENIIEDMKSQFDMSATEVAEAKEAVELYKSYIVSTFIVSIIVIFLIISLFVF